jgi:membrane-bound serine protease (ClpP class)
MNKKTLLTVAYLLVAAVLLLHGESSDLFGKQGSPGQPVVYLLDVDGSINPAVADYVTKGIDKAAENKAAAVIIRMDTPGGLVTTTKTIIKTMINAHMPVVVYVGPSGSSASSAGALITMVRMLQPWPQEPILVQPTL